MALEKCAGDERVNVGELIAELKKYDATYEVQVQYTESGGCCCNSYPDDVEKFVSHLFPSSYTDSVYEKGPRGGKKRKWRVVHKPSVVLRAEY